MPFFMIISVVLIVAWFYLWRRLVVTSALPKNWHRLVTTLVFALLIFEVAAPSLFRHLLHLGKESPLSLFFFTLTFSMLGFIDILLFFTIVKDLIILIYFNFFHSSENPERRLFLTRALNISALGVAGVSAALGTETAWRKPEVKRVKVPIKNLHPDLKNLTIAQISDLHIGASLDLKRVRYVVDTVNNLKPDLIALTGDVGDGRVDSLAEKTAPLAELKAPLGKFYVTGNHEYYWDVDTWIDHLQELGFDYLYNTHRRIKVKAANLLVGGVPDYMCSRVRPDHTSEPIKSMAGAAPADYKILLAHQPKNCLEAFKAGYDLQLSGHTHYGQFFPNTLVIGFFHPYVKGLNLHENKMWVYVNVGTGFWGPPQRLSVPAEITLLTLVKA